MRDVRRELRTIARLHPSQVAHRVRLRTQRLLQPHATGLFGLRGRDEDEHAPGWPGDFRSIELDLATAAPSVEANDRHEFRFLHDTRQLGTPPDWRPTDASQLWRYHLHYWDWGWAHLRDGRHDALAELWTSWSAGTALGRWDEWSPYVAATRAWFLGAMHQRATGAHRRRLGRDLGVHVRYLRRNLERDVGGNHLVRDLKGLLGGAVALGDDDLRAAGTVWLEREVARQILDDGGHHERSPAYHAQVLGDLVDVATLLRSASAPSGAIERAMADMRAWLSHLVLPDGGLAPFNDTFAIDAERLDALGVSPCTDQRVTVLEPSGYIVIRTRRLHVVVDVGLPCPPTLPAHAHADCLSFVACVDGRRVLTDPGSSTYEVSARRDAERGTRAHSTVEVDGASQTEVYGAFRAGRRARPRLEAVREDDGRVTVVASHDGYEHLAGRPRHRRTLVVGDESIDVIDEVTGSGRHEVVSTLHAAPGELVAPDRVGPLHLSSSVPWVSEDDTTSVDHGSAVPSTSLRSRSDVDLPVRWEVHLRARQDGADGSLPST